MKLWKEYLLIGLGCLPTAAVGFYVERDYVPSRGSRVFRYELPLIILILGVSSIWEAYARWKVEKKREAGQLAKQQHRAVPQAPSTQPKRPPARKADIRYRIASLVLVGLLLFVILSGIGRWGLFD